MSDTQRAVRLCELRLSVWCRPAMVPHGQRIGVYELVQNETRRHAWGVCWLVRVLAVYLLCWLRSITVSGHANDVWYYARLGQQPVFQRLRWNHVRGVFVLNKRV